MSTLDDFSRLAARKYLQSAVFVDDNIFDYKTGMPVVQVDTGIERKPIFRPASGSAIPPSKTQQDEPSTEQPYHPKDLVSSFAREGITCALYEPPQGFSTDPGSEIFKLCERPDIIILDWDFSGDQGKKALDLIAALVKQSVSQFPHQTRLISIYTADQSLVAVANKIADRLRAESLPSDPDGAQCRLRSAATRLVVLGKPIGRFGEEEKRFTVKESDLANKLIEEFAGMNVGILPTYALHGLAAIRRHSKRILDRFHGRLDGAFLLHRELIADSEEAFDQLPELLSEELRAVVEDQRWTASQIADISQAALDENGITQDDKSSITSFRTGMKPKKIIKEMVQRNMDDHLRLAILFASQTQYSSDARSLGFGTIIRHKQQADGKWEYALCLIPSCDGLRLDSSRPAKFPFWNLQEDVVNYTGMTTRSAFVLPLSESTFVLLAASGAEAGEKLWIDEFQVDVQSKTVVANKVDGDYTYSGSKRTIQWIGQLKPLHAHRIAHSITENLSRVGLSEAEWLRVLCARN